eukprot:COSAG03_NODE_18655_length_350_cov_9.932271_1_plen_96_part_01
MPEYYAGIRSQAQLLVRRRPSCAFALDTCGSTLVAAEGHRLLVAIVLYRYLESVHILTGGLSRQHTQDSEIRYRTTRSYPARCRLGWLLARRRVIT